MTESPVEELVEELTHLLDSLAIEVLTDIIVVEDAYSNCDKYKTCDPVTASLQYGHEVIPGVIREAFEKLGYTVEIYHLKDSIQAPEYLVFATKDKKTIVVAIDTLYEEDTDTITINYMTVLDLKYAKLLIPYYHKV